MSHLDPKRPELHIMRVANGWIVQFSAVAQPLNPETGEPFTSNAAGAHVARTHVELADIIRDWAYMQDPAQRPFTPEETRALDNARPIAAGVLRATPYAHGTNDPSNAHGGISPDPSLLSRNRDD